MQIGHPSRAFELFEAGGGGWGSPPAGVETKSAVLLTGEEGAPNNYHLALVSGGSRTPRQRRTFEQVRYLFAGEYLLDGRALEPGTVLYLPESAYYGPQDVAPDATMLMCMLGGPSGQGFFSPRQRKEAFDGLRARGTFSDGRYHWTDGDGIDHVEDAYDALWSAITGAPTRFAPPRYDAPIVMCPAHYAWRDEPGAPGVERKTLGVFTERAVRIGFLRLAAGASVEFGTASAPELAFLERGVLRCGDVELPPLTAFATTASDPPERLFAVEDAELFTLKLPRF
jgi:hypothetical protein